MFPAAEGEPLPVEAVPGDSTVLPRIVLRRIWLQSTPSGVAVAGLVVLVVTEAVPGVEAAIVIALPRKRHFDLDWCVGQDAAVYKQL